MGARDCTRASSATCARSPRVRRLQWGRAIVRAQARRRTGRRRGANGSFNGGARLYARKRRRARIRRASSTSFNGGARLYARKPLRLGRDGLGRHASMEARDCTRASAELVPATAPRSRKLQWGRAIVRAQAAVSLAHTWACWLRLQWGRAIVRAQASCRCRRRRTRRGFNGGARLYARKQGQDAETPAPLRASMGARDCMRASIDDRVTTLRALALQWGRAIVRAQADDGALAP